MKRSKKYQVGGDTDFFNQLVDQYSAQQDQQDYQPQYEEVQQQPQEENSYDEQAWQDKYDALQSQYDELNTRVNSLSGQNFQDDSFLNFLFSDSDNKMPIDFSGEGGGVPQTSSTSNKGFRSFGSYQQGRDALENQLHLYQTGRTRNPVKPSSSIYEAMSVYAPAADHNDPKHYAQFIADKLGVSIDTPISQINTQDWADAIEQMEGNKSGNNPGNLRYQLGGPTAGTPNQLYNGLNDPYYAQFGELNMNLPQQFNEIRGLDNGTPVHVQDEIGQSAILHGKNHKKYFFGNVKEKML
jgi:hypothetical protein